MQRVKKGKVKLKGKVLANIGQGLVVLLGVSKEDNQKDVSYIVDKIANLRIFSDKEGKFNLSVKEVDGQVLAVSQFTLFGDCRRGRRPSFSKAASLEKAKILYEKVLEGLQGKGLSVKQGKFQAKMSVEIINDGPVTILLDSQKLF